MTELRTHNITLEGKTSRGIQIRLRPMTEGDWDILARWNNDPVVLYYNEVDNVSSYTFEEVQGIYRYVSQNAFCFIIQADGRPVGECCLQRMNLERILSKYPDLDCRRIDIMIGEKEYWSQGIGTESIRLVTDFGFESENADMIFYCNVADYNIRSQKACQKAGYELMAEIREEPGFKANFIYDYSMTRERWNYRKGNNSHTI